MDEENKEETVVTAPTANQQLTREKILEKAKERLIAREEKYLESLADMDTKLVVDKMRSAVIEQGKLVDLHQRTLEEHKTLVEQANRRATTALEEADALRDDLVGVKDRLSTNTELVKQMINVLQEEQKKKFWYKVKAFFGKFRRSDSKALTIK